MRVRENKWAGKIYGVLTRSSNSAVLARAPLQLLLFHFVVVDDEGQKKERKKKNFVMENEIEIFFFLLAFTFFFPSFSVNSPLSYQLTQVIFDKLSIQLFNHVIPRSS